jgi:hypothetical protein
LPFKKKKADNPDPAAKGAEEGAAPKPNKADE